MSAVSDQNSREENSESKSLQFDFLYYTNLIQGDKPVSNAVDSKKEDKYLESVLKDMT